MASDPKKAERPGTEPPAQRGQHAETPRRDWEQRRELDRSAFSPFAIMRQGLDEMERWVGQLGWGGRGSWSAPGAGMTAGRGVMSQMGQMAQRFGDWMPAIEAFQRGNEFVVRAEVPGLSRQDLTVEAGDDSLTIRGERRQEQEEDRDGLFWTERSYGSFTRVIPLPPGTIADSAKASFTNGVLEVVMQAPSADARRGRRIDISGTPIQESNAKK